VGTPRKCLGTLSLRRWRPSFLQRWRFGCQRAFYDLNCSNFLFLPSSILWVMVLVVRADNVKVWSTRTFERLYSIHSHHDVGDIFTVVYSSDLKTIYCGGQNTSLQVSLYPPPFRMFAPLIASSGVVSISTHLQPPKLLHICPKGLIGFLIPRGLEVGSL
jgi:hypothetical protein